MARRAPPDGAQDLTRWNRLLARLLSRLRVLNGGAYSRDVCFIVTKTRKFGPTLLLTDLKVLDSLYV